DPGVVGMALEADAEHVPGLPVVPVRRRPDRNDACDGLSVVDPDLHAQPRSAFAQGQQVVVDCEPLRLRPWHARVPLRACCGAEPTGLVEVAARGRPEVAGNSAGAPAQVVDRRDVGEDTKALDLAEVEAGLPQAGRVDYERRLAVLFLGLDEPGYAFVGQVATPRISYAGGTPAWIFSWRRTIPSSSASGRGGQPGTCMSTGAL